MLARDQALLMNWKWKSGYQSHFITPDNILIPTCNVPSWANTKEELAKIRNRQIKIIVAKRLKNE